MRLRSFLLNFALLLGSLLFVIAGLEFLLRVTGIEKGRPMPPPIYQRSPNPDISYELKPNMQEKAFREIVTTNSLGFRSSEPDPAKPVLALLGDSITFGYGTRDDETLGAVLQREFPEWSVQNTAVPGYNLRQERATYEAKLRALNPKILLLVFYWNDLENMVLSILADDGNIRPADAPHSVACNPIREGILGWIPGKCWLDLHSSVYRVLKKVVSARTEKKRQLEEEHANRSSPFDESIPAERLQDYGRELDTLVALLPPDLPRLFVIWPDRRLHFTLRPQLKTFAESRGFRVFDFYEVFGNSPETLAWDTSHPSPATLQTAGEIIAATLRHYRLLP